MLVVIQLAFTYLPFMQAMFGVVALDAAAWGLIAAFGILLFVVVELKKLAIRMLLRRSYGHAGGDDDLDNHGERMRTRPELGVAH